MIVQYEVEKHPDKVTVWAINHRGHRAIAAEVVKDDTLQQIAAEFFELLASIGGVPIIVKDAHD